MSPPNVEIAQVGLVRTAAMSGHSTAQFFDKIHFGWADTTARLTTFFLGLKLLYLRYYTKYNIPINRIESRILIIYFHKPQYKI